jgi:hypothetical protein
MGARPVSSRLALSARGQTRRVTRFVQDKPFRASLLGAFACFVTVHGSFQAREPGACAWLADYLVAGGCAYAVAVFVLCLRFPRIAGPEPAMTRCAYTLAANTFAVGAAFFSGHDWAAWSGLVIALILLMVTAALTSRKLPQ